MKTKTKQDLCEDAVYKAIQYLNGSSNLTTDEIYSILLKANDFEENITLRQGVKSCISKNGKYKALKVYGIQKEQTLWNEERNETLLTITVLCKNKKNK